MVKTILSSEIEYGIMPCTEFKYSSMTGDFLTIIPKLPHHKHVHRGHLKNGALVYLDFGDHPEYSSPLFRDPF